MAEADRSRRTDQGLDPVLFRQPAKGVLIDVVEGISLGIPVQLDRVQKPVPMGARHHQQGRVDRGAIVDEHGHHQAAGFGHAVHHVPGAVILVPLPGGPSRHSRLGVDAALMQVDLFLQQLPRRTQQARQQRQPAEGLGVEVGAEDQPGGPGVVLFGDDFRSRPAEDLGHRLLQRGNLPAVQQPRKEDKAAPVELF